MTVKKFAEFVFLGKGVEELRESVISVTSAHDAENNEHDLINFFLKINWKMQKDLLNIVTLDFQLFLYFLSFFDWSQRIATKTTEIKVTKLGLFLNYFFNEIKPSLTEN